MASASAELTLPSRKSTLSPSISLRAFCTATPASPLVEVLDHELGRTAEDAALGVDLVERQLAAVKLVLPVGGVGAGQRIIEADPDRVGGAGADDEWARDLDCGEGQPRLDEPAAAQADGRTELGHASSPLVAKFRSSSDAGAPVPTILRILDRAAHLSTRAPAVKRRGRQRGGFIEPSAAADLSKPCGARLGFGSLILIGMDAADNRRDLGGIPLRLDVRARLIRRSHREALRPVPGLLRLWRLVRA